MNKYGTCNEPVGVCENVAAPSETLSDIMHSTNCTAGDILRMVHRINNHLFAIVNPCCEKEVEPNCFSDELIATRCELLTAAEELSKICSRLGV